MTIIVASGLMLALRERRAIARSLGVSGRNASCSGAWPAPIRRVRSVHTGIFNLRR